MPAEAVQIIREQSRGVSRSLHCTVSVRIINVPQNRTPGRTLKDLVLKLNGQGQFALKCNATVPHTEPVAHDLASGCRQVHIALFASSAAATLSGIPDIGSKRLPGAPVCP